MDGGTASLPAHRILRERTREAHEAAEATEGMRRLMDGRMDEAGYAELLGAQLDLFREWEVERAAWLRAIAPRWAYRSRIAPLETDLAASSAVDATGSHPSDNGLTDEGRKRRSHRPFLRIDDTAATLWGELYVVEGSTLGARLIVRHLRDRFPAHPHRYYALGETPTAPWHRFQSLLDAELTDDVARRHAVEGAHRMFSRFQRTLQDPAAHV